MKAYPEEARRRAAELHAQGFGWKEIGRELGVPYSTVIRWLNPAYAERQRQSDRARKESMRGVCVDCGAATSWGNGVVGEPSLRCSTCVRAYQHQNRVWTPEAIIEAVRWAYATLRRPLRTEDFHTRHIDGLPNWNTLRREGYTTSTACEAAGVPFHSGYRGWGARGGGDHGTEHQKLAAKPLRDGLPDGGMVKIGGRGGDIALQYHQKGGAADG